MVPRLRECCRQTEAEVVSMSMNKIHQTWGPPFNLALYVSLAFEYLAERRGEPTVNHAIFDISFEDVGRRNRSIQI